MRLVVFFIAVGQILLMMAIPLLGTWISLNWLSHRMTPRKRSKYIRQNMRTALVFTSVFFALYVVIVILMNVPIWFGYLD